MQPGKISRSSLINPIAFLDSVSTSWSASTEIEHLLNSGERAPFFFLGENGGGLGIKNYTEWSSSDLETRWKVEYLKEHLYGCEGCFSCPIHCGRISQLSGDYSGGAHIESAWSLGPRIGIFDWTKTLRILRICQLQGLDPSAVGSIVAWLMDCYERRVLSSRDLGLAECLWGSEATALNIIESVIGGKKGGGILRKGSLGAARALGKGLELVPHFCAWTFRYGIPGHLRNTPIAVLSSRGNGIIFRALFLALRYLPQSLQGPWRIRSSERYWVRKNSGCWPT